MPDTTTIKRSPFARAHEIAARFRQESGPKPLAEKKNDRGSLYLYEPIGAGWFGDGLTAKRIVDELDALKGVKVLDIFINCEGGDVFEAKAIYTNLKRFEAEKVVHIDGLAASAATFVAMAGDRIITAKGANWMIHEAACLAYGWAEDLRATADLLDLQNRDIADIYAARTGNSAEKCLAWMSEEKWMSADEALALKFSDAIEGADEPVENAASARIVALSEETRRRVAASRAAIASMGERVSQRRASPTPQREGQPERTRSAK